MEEKIIRQIAIAALITFFIGTGFDCNSRLIGEPGDKTDRTFPDFIKSAGSLPIGSRTTIKGVFDLKSICLNLQPHNNPAGNSCDAFLAENSEGNAEAIEVELRLCRNGTTRNCIEPLPDDAPPEVIVIRDSDGNRIEEFAQVKIELVKQNSVSGTGFYVDEIN